VKYDPSEIVPYVKKKIFQSLNALNYEFIQKEKDKVNFYFSLQKLSHTIF